MSEQKRRDHGVEHKVMTNPRRRKVIRAIGVYGATLEEIKERTGLDDSDLKFNIDFLLHAEVAYKDGDTYWLTDNVGIAMLEIS